MGVAISASAFMVLELGALVIYDRNENSCSEGGMGCLTKFTLKNSNTL